MPRQRTDRKRKGNAGEKEDQCEGASAKKKQASSTMATCSSSGDLTQELSNAEWKTALQSEMAKDYFKSLQTAVSREYQSETVFPPKALIFNALNLTPLSKVKVVLLGQDPYHDDGQAMGLAFSVPEGVKIPPSLRNMFTELSTDIPGFKIPGSGSLEKWAKQGVLLLNATLTVKAHSPNSHSKLGWQKFTDSVIKLVSDRCNGVVFMLWGNFAHKKEKLIDANKHIVLKDAHPSPLSIAKYRDCKCFSRANDALKKLGKKEIDWKL